MEEERVWGELREECNGKHGELEKGFAGVEHASWLHGDG